MEGCINIFTELGLPWLDGFFMIYITLRWLMCDYIRILPYHLILFFSQKWLIPKITFEVKKNCLFIFQILDCKHDNNIIIKKEHSEFSRENPLLSHLEHTCVLIFTKYRKSKGKKWRRKTTLKNKKYKDVWRCQINIAARSILNATAWNIRVKLL